MTHPKTTAQYIWLTDADEQVSPAEMPVLGVCAVGGLVFLKVAKYTEDGTTNTYTKIVEVSVPVYDLMRAIELATDDSVMRQGPNIAAVLQALGDAAAEIERLNEEVSTMHPSVVHQCCEDVQAWKALAEQAESALRAVRADRPSSHTDEVWAAVQDALHAFDSHKAASRD